MLTYADVCYTLQDRADAHLSLFRHLETAAGHGQLLGLVAGVGSDALKVALLAQFTCFTISIYLRY